MNILTLLHIVLFLIIASLLWMRKPQWALGLFVGAVILQLIISGHRWQFIPLYLFIVIPILLLLWQNAPQWVMAGLIFMMFCGFLLTGFLNYTFPEFAFPEPTGDYPVGVTKLDSTNDADAVIWYPAAPTENDEPYGYLTHFDKTLMGAPPIIYSHLKGKPMASFADAQAVSATFPVIIYAHSADGFAEENSFLLTDLASHGYVVVAIAHARGASEYDLDLQSLGTEPETFMAAMKDYPLPDRLKEVEDVIAALPAINSSHSLLQDRLDLSQINFVGYSLGGGVLSDYCALHDQCTAVLNLDGNPFMTAHTTGLSAPYFHISQNTAFELAATDGPGSPTAQTANLYIEEVSQVVANTKGNGKTAEWIMLNNSGHATFTDMAHWIGPRWGFLEILLGTVDTELAHEAIHTTTIQFLQNPTEIQATIESESELMVPFPE